MSHSTFNEHYDEGCTMAWEDCLVASQTEALESQLSAARAEVERVKQNTFRICAEIAEQNDGRTPGSEAEAEAMNIASAIRAKAAEEKA